MSDIIINIGIFYTFYTDFCISSFCIVNYRLHHSLILWLILYILYETHINLKLIERKLQGKT